MTGACAIIACDHGLGHVRRCALMARDLELRGQDVTLFAPSESVSKLQRAIPFTKGLTVENLVTNTSADRIKRGLPDAIEWLGRLPSLEEFDTVVCDNFPEILTCRPDAIISAQFFWHDVIEGASPDYVEFCRKMLAQHKPAVIGCGQFAMEVVRNQPGFRPVGLYKNPELVAASEGTTPKQRNELLVSGGTTISARNQLQSVVDELLETGPGSYQRVNVDSELMPPSAPRWMVAADFSVSMFCRLKTAICRPGLGLVTDLLTVGAMIIPVYENGNTEMEYNASVLKSFFTD